MKRILVTGAGGTPSTNFIRSLRHSNEKFEIIGVDSNKYCLQRAETDKKVLVPHVDDERYIAILNSIIDESKVEFVHAQPDMEVLKISRFRDDIHAKIFYPNKETIENCINKFKTYKIWTKNGLKVPKTILLNNEEDLKRAYEECGGSLWIREISGGAGKNSFPTENLGLAKAWIELKNGWGVFTAAENLSPYSVTWLSIWKEGELIVAQGRKRIYWEFSNRSPSGVTGITGTGVTVSDPCVDEIAQKAIYAVDKKPNGIFGVDLTYDKKGELNLTEINIGRFFTTHYFFTKAGLNMPEIYVKLAYGEHIPKIKNKINPLKEGLYWIRGMDMYPTLTTKNKIDYYEKGLEERLNEIKLPTEQ